MNGKTEEYLRRIDDIVQIDDKIVTYKCISQALKVHCNTAKQLLYAYTKKANARDKLLTTYIVAGEVDGGFSFRLVRAEDIEKTKEEFAKVTSIHVYSLQKGGTLTGADIYSAEGAQKLTVDDQKYSAIRPADNIERRNVRVPSTSNGANDSSATKMDPKGEATKRTSPRKSPPKKIEVKEPKGETTGRKGSPKKIDNKKQAAANRSGGIGTLFKKQAEKRKDDVSGPKVDEEKEEAIKGNKPPTKVQQNGETSKKELPKADKHELVKASSPKQSKKKRKKPGDSKDSAAKRRRRIQIASDSESTEESESDGDQRHPSPEPEPTASTVIESEEEQVEEIIPGTPLEKGRKRVRKLIDRTYEDDEGYIITKKEYVYESCSDNDDTEPAIKKATSETSKETGQPADKKKNAGPQKLSETKKADGNNKETNGGDVKAADAPAKKPGRPPSKAKASVSNSPKKQASILSFFKKK